MSELKLQDIVWAKVRSYPWWPGIITEINNKDPQNTQYRVDFISENSHYILPKKYVKIFEGNIELPPENKEKSKMIQDLQKAMVIAHKINSGELQKENLFEINHTYFSKDLEPTKKRQTKEEEKKSRISSLEKKIEEMTKTRNFLPEDKEFELTQVIDKKHTVQKIEKKLIGFISREAPFDDISKEDLLDAFEKILENDPTEEIVNNAFIMKSLKYFFKEFIESSDHQLVMFAKIAKRLYFYWRNVGLEACLEEIMMNYNDGESDESEPRPVKKRKSKDEGRRKAKKKVDSDTSED